MEWISVKNQLPKSRHDLVLVYTPTDLGDQKIRMMQGQFVKIAIDSTHWMPLPEPPKESK